ncbi:MAG: DUF2269 domain-containing protein [Candidatus Eremiobacteraeota bacterium]|nr:DUF2269 domain-containing protein [Candidatus Eremiobacteraeota bacterium]
MRKQMAGLETLHVTCAILWLGNFVVTGFWSVRAWMAHDDRLRAFAVREILVTDAIFTLVFGTAVTLTGILLAQRTGVPLLGALWTRTALEAVTAAGVVWMAVLLPLELRMRKLAAAGAGRAFDRTFVAWNVVGWLVTIGLFAVIYLMVEKPT